MAQITITSGWMTSFIYEQDLTSYYMNNVLTGIFRPGVYNANLAIVQSSDGLYLSIKKGTTLLFSNTYKKADDLPNIGCRRNFSNIKNEVFNNPDNTSNDSLVLIKCVAQNDIFQKIASSSDESILGANRPHTMYLFAYMRYIKTSGDDSNIPVFMLACPNNQRREPLDEFAVNNYLYTTLFPVYNYDNTILHKESEATKSVKYIIPDGCINYSLDETSRYLQNYSFLNLGILVESSNTYGKTFTDSGINDWVQSFTFTSHGLPEYRHNITSDGNVMNPDIIMYSKSPRSEIKEDPNVCETAFIDLPNTLIKNTVYNRRIEKENVALDDKDYCWEYCYDNEKLLENQYQFKYQKYLDKTGEYTIPDKISFDLKESELSEIDKYSDNVLIIDAVYGTSKSEIVGNDEISLYNFSDESFQNNMKYSNYRIITTINNSADKDIIYKMFNYKTDKIWYLPGKFSSEVRVLPLDSCEYNTNRLLPLVQNKNIWSKIIDKIRFENDQYPEETSDITPIALIFRCFSKNNQDKEKYDLKEMPISSLYTFDMLSTTNTINPVNMISYFDLCNKMTKINNLNLTSENVFNLIPILK